MKPTQKNIDLMLSESNKIEMVYDKKSLTQAKAAWKYIMQFDKLNAMIIKETHRILMKDQDIEYKYKGDFRDVPVMIGGKVKNQPKIVIGSLVRDWCAAVNKSLKGKPDVVYHHVKFEDIHPFIDGNGRIGRILMNWQAIKSGQDIQVFTEENKQDYYKHFRIADFMNDLLMMNARDL